MLAVLLTLRRDGARAVVRAQRMCVTHLIRELAAAARD